MKIVFFGTGRFGLPALESLKKKHEILAVASSPDKPQGRRLEIRPSPAKEWASREKLSLFDFEDINSAASVDRLKALKPDLIVVIDFGFILSEAVLSVPRLAALNVHASLLPKYRGAAPIQWALLNGDEKTGVSVIRMSKGLDAGDIVVQKEVSIRPEEDAIELEKRLSQLGAEAALEAARLLEAGSARPWAQDAAAATNAPKIRKEDGRIDWRKSAREIKNRLRALAEWPGCHAFFDGKRILIRAADVEKEGGAPGAPGTVIEASPRLVVAAGRGSLNVRKLQLEGRRAMDWIEFAKGFRIEKGRVFE